MTKYEYELLTGNWDGPPGAALNQCFEFCVEEGWMDHLGIVTPKGRKAVEEYEQNLAVR